MREALAAADHDYTLTEPLKPRSKPKRGRSGAARRGSRKPFLTKRRAFGLAASALCVAALAGVAINALTLQKARHPAPLFGHVLPRLKEPAAQDAAVVPVPAPRPDSRPAPKSAEVAPAPPDRAVAASEDGPLAHPRAAPAAAVEAEARPHDAISDFLRGGGVQSRPAEAAASKTVLAAQKALVKLGFVLKADGVMGATTKQAIERYEHDRGRVSHGELTPAVLRRLSAESGIAAN